MSKIPQQLPIVRRCQLPPAGAALQWQEKGDIPAALVVLLVAIIGAVLGSAGLYEAALASAVDLPLVIAALVILLPCGYAMIAAFGELRRAQTVSIDAESVRVGQMLEPLTNYCGLLILDRTRRAFIRNQVTPLTGRRGPVTEFVIALRHRDDRDKDVEVFRAQPSLQTLLTMHAMQDAASGRASSANANACLELVSSYRAALRQLSEQLDKPVLVIGANESMNAWRLHQLDEWMQPLP